MSSEFWGLDFETFSDVDLPKHGAVNYFASEAYEPLIASVVTDEEELEFDFVNNPNDPLYFRRLMQTAIRDGQVIVAHNAQFERRVLRKMGLDMDHLIVDSAVMSRIMGVGSRLEVASRQLTDSPKLDSGMELIKLFSIPHEKMQEPSPEFCQEHAEQWAEFGRYCTMDARGGKEIVENGLKILKMLKADHIWDNELAYEGITSAMNDVGWQVDRQSVEWMNKRSWANSEIAKADFIQRVGADLNFKSPQQLKKFCADRGVTYTSLDKWHAPIVLENTIELEEQETDPEKKQGYRDVITMLEIKLEIGGSTLTKLPTILNNVDDRNILRDNYIHAGAGQTFRTTGTKVQMQNLKKLDGDIRDMDTLTDYSAEWTNTDMAGQLRQVFTSRHPQGKLVVGDFGSVESRALAYLSGEQWKLDSYEQGLDIYKVLVTKYDNISYEEVTKEKRPKGKYTELSCGYQASGKAVQDVMVKYGVKISLDTSAEWVSDWRAACPNIVEFWRELDTLLKQAVMSRTTASMLIERSGVKVDVIPFNLKSMKQVDPHTISLCIQLTDPGESKPRVVRFVHGAYLVGKGIAHYKPVEGIYGDKPLWSDVNETATQKANKGRPKGSKKKRKIVLNTIYGGKLTGILTQSFCREMFFESLTTLHRKLENVNNAKIVGQFHDEIVVDWLPEYAYNLSEGEEVLTLEQLHELMEECMSTTSVRNFPLVAEINSSFRYIK